MNERRADWPNLHSLFRKKFPVCWGANNMLLFWRATAALGRLDSHSLQYGYKYSQTCIYKENIKICTVANFQCVLSCRKTPIKVCKNSFVKKSEKAFLGNSALKAHLKYQDAFTLLNTYPKQMENKTTKVFAKYSAVFFFMASLRLKQDAS